MRKEYLIVDKSTGEYNIFKKIQHSVEDCERVAREYKLDKYIICEREVSEWKSISTEEQDNELWVTETCDLFSVNSTKEEINRWIKRYSIRCTPKVSPEGQAYTEITGTYANVVCFLGEIYNMSAVDVMCNMGNEMFWCKPGRCK